MVVKYQRRSGLGELLGAFGESKVTKQTVHVDWSGGLLNHLKPGQMYLLPSYMVP
jgi:hypothetical protein